MADVSENLRTFLLADATVSGLVGGERIKQNTALQGWAYPFVVYFRTGTESERTLDESAGTAAFRHYFDIECASDDIDEAADLAEAIRAYADGYDGTFGTMTAQGVFVDSHDDDYDPRLIGDDDPIHVAALRFEIAGVA